MPSALSSPDPIRRYVTCGASSKKIADDANDSAFAADIAET